MVILDSMISSILIIFVSMVGIVTLLGYFSLGLILIDAQTPTTSDLPATIGNESLSDKGLSNKTLPVQNTTTIDTTPPM